MTIAKDFASKFAVAFVAVAMIFTAIAPAVQAQETEDLQKTINDLLAQVAALQAQTGQGSTSVASGICPFAWNMDLKAGSTGADVMKLQQFLNADEDTRVAASGAGSVGAETTYFGPATGAAVSKFQVKYRAEILSPAGLVNPTGFFGPGSRAQANKLCSGATTPDDSDDEDDSSDDEDSELSGEGELSAFEIDNADETDIEEGAEDAEIAVLTIEAEDGDISVNRIDFNFAAGTTEDPWDVFETITLWVDGDMIAEFDASDEDEYLDEDDGEFRFSGLDLVVMEDEEVEVTVAATIAGSVDTLEDWDLDVDQIRYFDADGVATDEDGTVVTNEVAAAFDIVEEGDGEELKFSLGSNSPDATDVIVDEDSSTDDVTLLEYTIEAEEGDIELNMLYVNFVVELDTYANIVDDVRIVIDGEEFDGETPTTANGSTTVAFDVDGDVVIDADSEVTVEVVADINSQDNFVNASTIKASVRSYDADQTDAEGADNILAAAISGSATGEEMTLVAEGITSEADADNHTADATGDADEYGEFTIEFDVTAVEGDFYINDLASTTAATGNGGVEFGIETSGAGVASVVSGTLSSTGDDDTGAFVVRDGETETFTLTVTFTGATAGQFRVVLEEIWYSDLDTGLTATLFTPTPTSDYRTDYKQVN